MEPSVPKYRIFAAVLAGAVSAFASLIADPIPLSSQGNLLLDRDNNGALDGIQLEFVSNISATYLETQIDSIVLTWPSSDGSLLRIVTRGSEFRIDSLRPRRIVRTLPDSIPVAPNLTSIQPGLYPFEYGVVSYFADGNTSSMPVRVRESLPPVITEVRLLPAHAPRDPDTLWIHFSESAQPLSSSGSEYFGVRPVRSASTLPLTGSRTQWYDMQRVQLLLSPDQLNKPVVGDSICVLPAKLRDVNGNVASSGGIVFHPIAGRFPFTLLSQPKATFTPHANDWEQRPIYQVEFRPFADSVAPADWLGIGLDYGSTSLAATIQGRIDANFTGEKPDPAKLDWHTELWIYTNDGQPVHHSRIHVSCADPRFANSIQTSQPGNCFEFPSRVYLRWNLRTLGGKVAATGAYIARVGSRMTYQGQTIYSISPESPGGTVIWGIERNTHGSP